MGTKDCEGFLPVTCKNAATDFFSLIERFQDGQHIPFEGVFGFHKKSRLANVILTK